MWQEIAVIVSIIVAVLAVVLGYLYWTGMKKIKAEIIEGELLLLFQLY